MSIDDYFLTLRKIARTNGPNVMQKLFDDYLTGRVNKELKPSCFLCGATSNLTKEHILPKWVFESNNQHFFISDVNQLNQAYIRATVPACKRCNNELLNGIERYIQKTLATVDMQHRYYSTDEWENIIRWLEIIDFKFQVWDIMTKFRVHKKAGYVPFLADFPIAVIRLPSIRTVTSQARRALRRISTKNKSKRAQELVVGRTIKKTFHYFHTNSSFMHLELPTYNKGFFIFFEKEHKNERATLREMKKLIILAYNLP